MASVDESLKQTFRTLFMEQRYAELSVDKLCQAAKVSRSAFYKRYSNKDELIASILEDDLVKPTRDFRRTVPTYRFADQSQAMVDSIQYERILEQRDFYKKLFRECPQVMFDGLTASLVELNREVMADYPIDDVEKDYVAGVFAADHVYWMFEWIKRDYSISPEELARLHHKWSISTWESICKQFQ